MATLKPSRSVDLAGCAALIVREAGATLQTVDGDVLTLDLDSRSRTVAARDPQWAETLRSLVYGDL